MNHGKQHVFGKAFVQNCIKLKQEQAMASLALSCCALPAFPAAVPCGQEAAAWAAAAVPWLGTAAPGKAAGDSRGCPGLC